MSNFMYGGSEQVNRMMPHPLLAQILEKYPGLKNSLYKSMNGMSGEQSPYGSHEGGMDLESLAKLFAMFGQGQRF